MLSVRLIFIIIKEQNRGKSPAILKFSRSKSRDNKNKNDELQTNEEKQIIEQITLGKKLKANFEKNKIKNMENPANQETDVKFKRDKSAITQGVNKLKDKICKLYHLINYL